MTGMHIRPFDLSKENELLEFAQAYPWRPTWSRQHIQEFIRQLTSSHELIIDIFSGFTRVSSAVLIDKIKNKGNNACLEFLGMNNQCDLGKVYTVAIQKAKERLSQTRSGIEITVHESLNEIMKLLLREGFTPYYDTFEMVSRTKKFSDVSFNQISYLGEDDYIEYYDVMVESFQDNLDICIPAYEDWKLSRQQSKGSQAWVYKENGKIIGFLSMQGNVQSGLGEIRTIGVLPSCRNKGIGRHLLCYGLHFFAQQQLSHCHLTVATKNESALKLYQDLGFSVVNHYKVCCWKAKID